jgi:hypothetical protein
MGLKQNTVLVAQMPLRLRGGDPGTLRPMWGRTDLRNFKVGEGIDESRAAIPSGHLAPSAWVLPYKPGGAASRNIIRGSSSLSATGIAVQALQPISASITASASVTPTLAGVAPMAAVISVNESQATAAQIADAVWSKTLP